MGRFITWKERVRRARMNSPKVGPPAHPQRCWAIGVYTGQPCFHFARDGRRTCQQHEPLEALAQTLPKPE